MRALWTDVRSGIRMLVKYPSLSVVAVLTFGLGIGLSATAFSIANGGLFKGLPFDHADRIVAFQSKDSSQNRQQLPISVQDFAIWEARQTFFDKFGQYDIAPINLSTEEGRPERYSAGEMTVPAFELLGVSPLFGRGLQAGDDRPSADPVIVLGYEIWRDRFGSSREVLHRSVRVNGVYRAIVGVMPERFGFPIAEKAWIPLVVDPLATPRGKGPSYQVVGLLKPGIPVKEASARAAVVAAQLAQEFPKTNQNLSAEVAPYAKTIIGSDIYGLLFAMLGAGIGVLLIACVNVSNLLVARASMRQREVAVRMALGASRSRVIRQHLTEVLVLATLGALVGMATSSMYMRWFLTAMSVAPPPFWITFELDVRVMLFMIGVVVLASLAGGGLPALQAARTQVTGALKDDSRGTTSSRFGKFSGVLVVVELALSCGLLIAAGLMIKSVAQLKNVKMPFAVENILTSRINLPRTDYPDEKSCVRFYQELLPKLQSIPGVEAATLSDGLPAQGNGSVALRVDGTSYPRESDVPVVREGIVTPGYFETFQTKLLRGREFTPADIATSEPVVIVNESLARASFGGADPMGRRVRRGPPDTTNPWMTIVGVAPDMLMQGIGNNSESPAGYYIPIAQSDVTNFVNIAVRTRGEASAVTVALRSAVASLDPDLAIYDIKTLREVIQRRTWFYTVFGTFFMAFGACALFLAAVGLYGVMSFVVTQRTREMGVRVALGAGGRQLIGLVMRRSMIQLAIGLAAGVGLGLAASGALQPVLYYVDPRDPFVLGAVVVVLAMACLLASFLPARRVMKIDPVIALTAE